MSIWRASSHSWVYSICLSPCLGLRTFEEFREPFRTVEELSLRKLTVAIAVCHPQKPLQRLLQRLGHLFSFDLMVAVLVELGKQLAGLLRIAQASPAA